MRCTTEREEDGEKGSKKYKRRERKREGGRVDSGRLERWEEGKSGRREEKGMK